MKHLLRSLLALTLAFTFIVPPVARAADLSITAASFLPGANAKYITGIAGATITAGQAICVSASNGRYILADANDSTLDDVIGLAAHGSVAGQPLAVVYDDDDLTLGATLSMSAPVYVLSGTAGGIAPSADIAPGWYPKVILVAKSTTKCILKARALHGSAAATAAVFDLGGTPRFAALDVHRAAVLREEHDLALAA